MLKTAKDVEVRQAMFKRMVEKGRKRVSRSKRPAGSKSIHALVVGDLVRIATTGDKDQLGHYGERSLWTKAIYRVVKIVGSKTGATRYKLLNVKTQEIGRAHV